MSFIAAGAGVGLHITQFLVGSATAGANLIHQARQAETACRGKRGDAPTAHGASTVRGLLEIPSIGLAAPVENGVSDTVLNDAVGHVPTSAWPGQPGTSVLPAHNVTWFSRIDHLRLGASIRYLTPCRTYTYRVIAYHAQPASHPVYNTSGPSMVLMTCYPINALYPASTRYLVFATLVRVWSPATPAHRAAATPLLAVPAPRKLAAQGLDPGRNGAPLGVLRLAGTPSPAWQQSEQPWQAERAALAAYFGAIRSANERKRAWWSDVAPTVPSSAAAGLWGGWITSYGTRVNSTLHVHGHRVLGAVITATVTIAGPQPGRYDLTVTEAVVRGRTLVITRFRMRPASS